MESLIGKTIVKITQLSDRDDWHDQYEIECSDGSIYEISSDGGPYCSSSLNVKKVDAISN